MGRRKIHFSRKPTDGCTLKLFSLKNRDMWLPELACAGSAGGENPPREITENRFLRAHQGQDAAFRDFKYVKANCAVASVSSGSRT